MNTSGERRSSQAARIRATLDWADGTAASRALARLRAWGDTRPAITRRALTGNPRRYACTHHDASGFRCAECMSSADSALRAASMSRFINRPLKN